ncbi:hypothetical protein HYPSUDRAFT_66920 [Hypholoma sublateritium FD-334 SS-4]|uniref:Transcription regulator Rua1 C-terminal domain-containing protein n=1 Tax=Hypholoma sublateritium (strain FD-334 SS-4) TaxID=945553 RepID=A0A0D2PSJ2_HYPSF|nr:hypothetical protein HYPSUDRAFT_66920 [Hypholoma sublateritium FD-334 SS-4]
MSTTNAALDWLLSLSATFTSSPIPNSDPPDFTDWLQVSPTTSSPTAATLASSPPLQNITCSSRINLPQETQDLGLHYLYDLSGYFSSDISATSGSQSGRSARDATFYDGLFPASVQPLMFSEHQRMASLASSTATLVNTPSPRPRPITAGSTGLLREDHSKSPFFPSAFYSPATKFIEDLQNASFGYADMILPTQMTADISPVVRAAEMKERLLSDDRPIVSKSKAKRREKKARRHKHKEAPQSFAQRLRDMEPRSHQPFASAMFAQKKSELLLPVEPSAMAPPASMLPENMLLSPCRLKIARPASVHRETTPQLPILPAFMSDNPTTEGNPFSTPLHARASVEPLSPLTPLPSRYSSPSQLPRLKIVLNLKRERPIEDEIPAVRRSKRPRRAVAIIDSPSPSPSPTPQRSPSVMQESSPDPDDERIAYATRTLPTTIEVSDNFSLFYRRFPASSYFQPINAASPCTLFEVPHPGGIYNIPRGALDLYTPRFVKGKGVEKVGLCPICIEPPSRGGEKKKLWLAMKFSAFKCYHMQYAHGISASTGRPFSPPTAFRIIPRINPGKKEKLQIQQGKCHKCQKWVAVEGIKDMESKVKELYW